MSNKINEKLKRISESKIQNGEKQHHAQAEMRAHMTEQKDDTPDFAKMAEDLKKRHEEEAHSLNDAHQKMTIYVNEDIANAFNALCVKRGDQKKYINEALGDFVAKKYKELQTEKTQKNN